MDSFENIAIIVCIINLIYVFHELEDIDCTVPGDEGTGCAYEYIRCSANDYCYVDCRADYTCEGLEIEASSSYRLSVICGGEYSCYGMIVHCPLTDNEQKCIFTGSDFCPHAIYARNGWNDVSTGMVICPDDSDHGTMYCLDDFSESCTFYHWDNELSCQCMPTSEPTSSPTKLPSISPTNLLTNFPTKFPTRLPTNLPTKLPTTEPASLSTMKPTLPSTKHPATMESTALSTAMPSSSPTVKPTGLYCTMYIYF